MRGRAGSLWNGPLAPSINHSPSVNHRAPPRPQHHRASAARAEQHEPHVAGGQSARSHRPAATNQKAEKTRAGRARGVESGAGKRRARHAGSCSPAWGWSGPVHPLPAPAVGGRCRRRRGAPMAAAAERTDELVREYLLFRGFTAALKQLDAEIKADREKGFRVSGERIPAAGRALGAGVPLGGRAPRAGRGHLLALRGLGEGSGPGGGGSPRSHRASPLGCAECRGPAGPQAGPRIPMPPGPPCRLPQGRATSWRGFSRLGAPLPLGSRARQRSTAAPSPRLPLSRGLQLPAAAPRRWAARPAGNPTCDPPADTRLREERRRPAERGGRKTFLCLHLFSVMGLLSSGSTAPLVSLYVLSTSCLD